MGWLPDPKRDVAQPNARLITRNPVGVGVKGPRVDRTILRRLYTQLRIGSDRMGVGGAPLMKSRAGPVSLKTVSWKGGPVTFI